MSERAIVFCLGDDDLIGILHLGLSERSETGILIVVGGPQYRIGSHRQFVLMARGLAARGFTVFRFDYRGMGDSDGGPRTFESIDEDIQVAINAFATQVPSLRRVVVVGLCDAASAALMYAHSDPRVGGLVLMNPWVRTDASEARTTLRYYYVKRVLQRSFWSKVASGRLRLGNSAAYFLSLLGAISRGRRDSRPAGGQFVDRMLDGMMRFRQPVLLLLSENDLTAREFESLCSISADWRRLVTRPEVRRHNLKGADHTFSSSTSLDEAVACISEWLTGTYLTECEPRRTSGC